MPVARQVSLPIAEWAGLEVPLVRVEGGGDYIPIKPLCRELLGTEDDRAQRLRINRDPILSQLTAYLPVQTAGGTQDMLCLAWLGIGRWLDRLDIERVQEPYRPHLLNIMWAITFAAYEVVSGKRALPALVTIVPASRLIAALREDDVRRFLRSLAERMGQIEIANRDVKNLLLSVAGDKLDGDTCPCCGRPYA